MTTLNKCESWAAAWFATALHLHLVQAALEQPVMTSLMYTLGIKSRFTYTVVAVTVIYSIKSSSCPPHHKSLVNKFYLSLHLLLISVFLATHYSLTSHSIWSIASPALISPVQISPETSPARKAWSPFNRFIADLPPWAPKPLRASPYFALGWSQ